MSEREGSASFDAHIQFLRDQVQAIENVTLTVQRVKDEATQRMERYDPHTHRTEYSILNIQVQVHDANLASLGIASVITQEFVQVWEQHKLLSEYLEQKLSSEEFAELRKKIDVILEHRHALRFIDFLVNQHKETTENNAKSGS